MCGRYALTSSREALTALTGAVAASDFAPRYNISASQMAPAVAVESGRRLMSSYRFGLTPALATEERSPALVVNVRAETAAQRPAFRQALLSRRCLAPCDAWYEWRSIGRFKQPYMIRRADRAPMMLAAIWESWINPDGTTSRALGVLTVAAGADTASIHDRMPAVLGSDHWDAWLDVRVDGASLAMRCLDPAPAGTYETVAIGALINQPGNDGPEVQQPAPERNTDEPAAPRLI